MSMTENEAKAKLERTSVLWESATNTEMVEAVKVAIKALKEIQQYRTIGTVEDILKGIKQSEEEFEMLMQYRAIGTIEEFKALKEKDKDCIVKHLAKECSYNETGCSDCKGKERIRIALEKQVPKKPIDKIMYLECHSCGDVGVLDCGYCSVCGQKLD